MAELFKQAKQIEEQGQSYADDNASYDRKIEAKIFPFNDNVARQAPQRQKFSGNLPDQTDNNQCNAAVNKKFSYRIYRDHPLILLISLCLKYVLQSHDHENVHFQ